MPEEEQETLAEKALAALNEGRTAFKNTDYLTALKKAEEAIAYDPGDPVLHEFRALGLFALGKYSDAALVLNAVLASRPGWGWDTMIALYNSPSTYEEQLRRLEDYARGNPKAADAYFLLGYHYLTAGHLETATMAFQTASQLQPADDVARQLYELCSESSDGDEADDEAVTEPAEETDTESDSPPPTLEELPGTWFSDKGEKGSITLVKTPDEQFSWTIKRGDKEDVMKGAASIDQALLVLSTEQSQMVGDATLRDEGKKLNFVLAGGPDGDSGLTFDKKE